MNDLGLEDFKDYVPPSWDEFFMRHVYLVATKSKDPSTKIGAVIVKDKILLSEGYNGFCRGVQDTVATRWERPEKYSWIEHGEKNSIFNAARNGIVTLGATMYTNGMPCVDCARAVIQAGIKEVVLHQPWETEWAGIMKDKWQGMDVISATMFAESAVRIRYLDKKLCIPCLISEKVFIV